MPTAIFQELHGQAPVVTYATKTALLQFEAQSKTRAPPQQQQQQQLPPPQQHPGPMNSGPRISGPPPGPGPMRGYAPRPAFPLHGPPPPQLISAPPPIIHHPPPMTAALPPPQIIPHLAPPPIMAAMPPRGPPPALLHPGGPAPHVNPAFFPQVSDLIYFLFRRKNVVARFLLVQHTKYIKEP
jgi:cleavage and polyadenylation specificity factor subunit 6/7